MSLKKSLIEVKSLIDTPEKWCKYKYARDSSGIPVSYKSPRACSFCILGAVRRVRIEEQLDVLRELRKFIPNKQTNRRNLKLNIFNDNATHNEVMALFDRAIKLTPE